MAPDQFQMALHTRLEGIREAEERARERAEAASAELERLRARRIATERLYETEYGALPGASLTQSKHDSSVRADPDVRAAGPLTGLSWEDAMKRVLRDAGQGLHVKEIWSRLSAGGFTSGARDPLRSVVTIAIRSPAIAKEGPNIYAVTSMEVNSEESRLFVNR